VDIVLIWPSGKAKYFLFRGLKPFLKIENRIPAKSTAKATVSP